MTTNLKHTECINLLSDNYIGQLGYVYIDRPFIVPMTYFFDQENIIIGYSEDGQKTKAMRNYRKVSLLVSEKENEDICNSVLIHGVYEEFSGSEAKKQLHKFAAGIKDIILRKEERNVHCISEFSLKKDTQNIPIVFKITVNEITGKKITRVSS